MIDWQSFVVGGVCCLGSAAILAWAGYQVWIYRNM